MPRTGLIFTALFIQQMAASLSQAAQSTEIPTASPIAQQNTDKDEWYSLNWRTRSDLPTEQQASLPSFCTGDYIVPTETYTSGKALNVESDQVEFNENTGGRFIGNVSLEQQGRRIQADQMSYNQTTGDAQFDGNIVFSDSQMTMGSDQLNYNTNSSNASLLHGRYTIAASHMRGTAENIIITNGNRLSLNNTSYTFCEPGQNDWDIKASEINLYQAKGYGEAYHGRLRIKEIPVMYLPYYRFPISKDRLTGFLNPEISISVRSYDNTPLNVSITEFATPLYINIAPNYDDTFTPRYLREHGLMAENEFRYLNVLGEGQIDYSYLGNDKTNDLDIGDEDYREESERWSRGLTHKVSIGRHWQNRINYQEVSDIEFDDDFARSGVINRSSYLKQNAELEFNDNHWQFLTRLEQYQTIDKTIADASKPFHRLPQVELTKLNSTIANQFNYDFKLQATRFTRDNDALTGVNKIDGERLHTDVKFQYPLQTVYGYLKPSLQFSSTQYSFQNLDDSAVVAGYEDETTRNIYTASIDGGLYFERNINLFEQGFVQTLEPRIMLAYTPYEDQSNIPLFDTTETTFSYGSIFKANRFTGLDRIADTQQLSFGVTTRFLNEPGIEVFRASLGQIFHFADRRVELTPGDTTLEPRDETNSSSLAGEVQWVFAQDWRLKVDAEYNPHAKADPDPNKDEKKLEKVSAQLNYLNQDHFLFDMNFTKVEATNQKQVGMSLFVPVNDRWAFYGQKKHDIYSYDDDEKADLKEENLLNIEGILGIEYQNCCWRVQATYEEHTLSDSTKDYQLMFQLHLKGLGILGSKTEDILSERILGYEQRQIHDY
jgi:LPS-assembly protein